MPSLKGSFPSFIPQYVETESGSERVGVTLWDSEGLELNMVDLQLKEITNFIESKFENTFAEESKVARTPGFRDTHIHCVFLLLDPLRLEANVAARNKKNEINGVKAKANSFVKSHPEPVSGGLDDSLDLSVLRALKGKTTVVPVIAKADTVSTAHMAHLKRAVWASLKQDGLDTLEALVLEEDDDDDGGPNSEHGESDTSKEEDAERLLLGTVTTGSRTGVNGTAGGNASGLRGGNDNDDKFSSTTSHLDFSSSDEDSSSDFSATGFDLGKHTHTSPHLHSQPHSNSHPHSHSHSHSHSSARDARARARDNLRPPPSPPSPAPPPPTMTLPSPPPPSTTKTPPFLPLSTLSPDPYESSTGIIGRRFAWGMADPFNPAHCDFALLKERVFREWRTDLRDASREVWYEGWRTSRLNKKVRRRGTLGMGGGVGGGSLGENMGMGMGVSGGGGHGGGNGSVGGERGRARVGS